MRKNVAGPDSPLTPRVKHSTVQPQTSSASGPTRTYSDSSEKVLERRTRPYPRSSIPNCVELSGESLNNAL